MSMHGRAARKLGQWLYVTNFLVRKDFAPEYGLGFARRLRLVRRFRRTFRNVQTLSTLVEHLELAAAIFRVPPSVPGNVIECGCFQGGSTVNLSIACSAAGRRLTVCDSFEGLPSPSEDDRLHPAPFSEHVDEYFEGRFGAPLELVRENVRRHGEIEACDFVKGYFDQTLHTLNGAYVLGFLDVDLVDSLKPCIREIWPRLPERSRLYVHEARSLALVGLFFEPEWWQSELGQKPPGFIGGGTGLPLEPIVGSELGYAEKPAPSSA